MCINSDFWINNKIPRRAKARWPVIEIDHRIAWIPGFQPSDHFKVKPNTREVLVLKLMINDY